jgi:hypothetical protein
MVWLVKKSENLSVRIHVSFLVRCIMHQELRCGLPPQAPFFFEEAVNSDFSLCMPHFLRTGFPLQTRWFMQDFARVDKRMLFWVFFMTISSPVPSKADFLIFSNVLRDIHDMDPCDHFLWEFLRKDKKNSVAWSSSELYQPSDPPLLAEVSANFCK